MRVEIHDHRNGIRVVEERIQKEIVGIISKINPLIKTNNVSEIKLKIKEGLTHSGWSKEYRLDTESKITITSYRDELGLCLQTGNIARIYADLLKLQKLYLKGNIKAGIIIVPQKEIALKLASNMAFYERINKELKLFDQVITMPIIVIGFTEEVV